MKTRLAALALSTLALVGGIAFGWASAPPARGVVNELYLTIQPGTEAGTANMFYGWHTDCISEPGNEEALDWTQSGLTPVYFTRWATYGTGPSTPAGYGYATQNNSGCYRVRVRINRPDETLLGDLFYTHTDAAVVGEFTIGAGQIFNSYMTQRRIATSRETEMCTAFTGPNIHQYAGVPFGRNTSAYPIFPNSRNNVGVTEEENHQNYVTFQY